jgi:hypothetical protein
MRRINGADFYTARELADILGYEEVRMGTFGVFCEGGRREGAGVAPGSSFAAEAEARRVGGWGRLGRNVGTGRMRICERCGNFVEEGRRYCNDCLEQDRELIGLWSWEFSQ